MTNKFSELIAYLRTFQNVTVLYSGGTDSFFLLYACQRALGYDHVSAVTFRSQFMSENEIAYAVSGAKELGADHRIIDVDILSEARVTENDSRRCYYCKHAMIAAAGVTGVVFDGTNASDDSDYRPGAKALEEAGVLSPLKTVGYTKGEILSDLKELGYERYARPANACLATRVVSGQRITAEKLKMIERAEKLFEGVSLVRVRMDGDKAVVELLKEEIPFVDFDGIKPKLLALGFSDASLSKEGYVRGSANKKDGHER